MTTTIVRREPEGLVAERGENYVAADLPVEAFAHKAAITLAAQELPLNGTRERIEANERLTNEIHADILKGLIRDE